jgi:hypothetical protein
MYRFFHLTVFLLFVVGSAMAQDSIQDRYITSDVVPLTGKQGISWQTRAGDFMFKPYVLLQTMARMNYYDDEGLDLAEQDNVLNSGFGIPYAMVGFSGKAFGRITFNVALNSAASGAALLNQAWFDVNYSDAFRVRVGKFKTPFSQAYLVQLGETLMPVLPSSLTTAVNIPYSINSVNPTIASGFDIGVQAHGLLGKSWEYRAGIFNGTGIAVNDPQKTMSDDMGIPSLLYAARMAWMPYGQMPTHQGNPDDLNNKKLLLAASGSYNVEANYESSNDLRSGIEFAYLHRRLYLNAEGYALNMAFVERQKTSPNYLFYGGYAQAGYFVTNKLQPTCRVDMYDRNGADEKGILYMPAVGLNYYLFGYNLKLQAMYQMLKKAGHETTADADDDDNGMAEHSAVLLMQFSF